MLVCGVLCSVPIFALRGLGCGLRGHTLFEELFHLELGDKGLGGKLC